MTQAAPRTPRQWIMLAAAAVLLASLCLVAGRWQWNRYLHREEQIARISANHDSAPIVLNQVLDPAGSLAADAEWKAASVQGTYDDTGTVLLRNRPVNGQAGYHVLVPLRLAPGQVPDAGEILIIDRGFLPWPEGAPEAGDVPAPPSGQVTAVVTMRPAEPPSAGAAPAGQVRTIDPVRVIEETGLDAQAIAGAYGQLRTETPPASDELRPLPAPDLDPGSHLSYAFQWVIFALGAIGGFLLLLRRDRRERFGRAVTVGDLLAGEPGARPPRTARRRPTAEEEEDALIDIQLPGAQASDTNSR